jgi:soluble lytic murein transglycosylase-like protein
LPADWEKRLPADTLKKLDESAAQYGVPRNLIAAILWEESTFKEKASAGPTAEGQGMAGMSLGAQKDLITKAQRDKNPERESELKTFDRMKGPAAVSMAAEYLKQLYDDNGQHWPSATLAYRLGRSAVRDWLNGMGNDTEKIYPTRWEEGKTYLRKIFQGRSHLFDTENAPEYP